MKLNEYRDHPKWLNELTKEQQHEWYLVIKASLPQWRRIRGDVSDLEAAIREYEIRNNIV